MKYQKLTALLLVSASYLGITTAAEANAVLLTSDEPLQITYRIAHQNQNQKPVFSELQSAKLDKNARITFDQQGYDFAGVVLVSANGKQLPSTINQFATAKSCSMTTDTARATGALQVFMAPHTISCRYFGGVFG